jgi:hypothetical protein
VNDAGGPTGKRSRSDKHRISKKSTKPSASAVRERARSAGELSQPPQYDWLGALTDDAVVERHRLYVEFFKKFQHFEHPELFAEYLSVSHLDFRVLERAFFRQEESVRRARRPTAVNKIVRYRAPPVDQAPVDWNEDEDEGEGEDEGEVYRRQPRPDVVEALELLRSSQGDAFFIVLEKLGLPALRPDPWPTWSDPGGAEERRAEEEVRDWMWRKIDSWWVNAREGLRHESRRAAGKQLQRVGAVLAGKQRGRGRSTVANPRLVQGLYYAQLYRLLRAIALLHSWPWPQMGEVRIQLVAEACGLEPEYFRTYLQCDLLRPGWRPVQATRVWACVVFGIKPKTLSHVLSFTPKPPRLPLNYP